MISLSGLTLTPSVRAGISRDDLIVFRQTEQDDGNVAPTDEFEEPPPKPKRSAGWTVYSSVHEKNGKEDDSPWEPLSISPWRKKLRTIPPHTIVFSSTHIDAQGNFLNQPAAKETSGNALSVEVQELGSQDLTSTEHSTVDNSAQESSETTMPFEDLTLSKENESTVPDLSSVQTDSAETKILDTLSEHKEVPLSEENSISDESTLSENSSLTEFQAITEKASGDSDDEIDETKNSTHEIVGEETQSPESSGKQEGEKNLEDSAITESADLTDQTKDGNSEGQPDASSSLVKLPKSAPRGTKKTSSSTTRTRKKQPTKSSKEQSSSQLEAEVSEINLSPEKSDNVSDNQVESQFDEQSAASKIG